MTQQRVDGTQVDGSTLDLTGADGTNMVNVANLDANTFSAQQVLQYDFASTTYRAAGNDAGICGMRFTETGGTVGGLIMMAPDASDFGIWCGGPTPGDKKLQGSSTSKLLDLTATKMTYDGNDIGQANNAMTWTALQSFTRAGSGERAIDVTLAESQVVLSGDVNLRDFVPGQTDGISYLAAWSEVSNRNVGLTLRTLETGIVNTALTMAFDCSILAVGADDITFGGQSIARVATTNTFTVPQNIGNGVYRSYDNTDTDITNLIPGSAGGTLMEGQYWGQVVIGIRANDANDSFNVISWDPAGSPQEYTNALLSISSTAKPLKTTSADITFDGVSLPQLNKTNTWSGVNAFNAITYFNVNPIVKQPSSSFYIAIADTGADGAAHGLHVLSEGLEDRAYVGSVPGNPSLRFIAAVYDDVGSPNGWNTIIAGDRQAKTLALTPTDITYDGVSLLGGGGGGDLVDDTSPQLGGNLDVQGFNLFTSVTNGNIVLAPPGTGLVVVDELWAGQWLSDDAYTGLFRSDGVTDNYMIMANTATTHISSPSATGTVVIRGGNNNNTNAFVVGNGTGATIGGNEVWHAGNDGSGSGLDADKLDGYQASLTNTINTAAIRDSAGDVHCRLLRSEYTGANSTGNYYVVKNTIGTGDNYHRNITKANARNDLLSASSVSQSRLKTATSAQSSAITGSSFVGITRTGGNYALSDSLGATYASDTAFGSSIYSAYQNISIVGIQNLATINGTVYYNHRYVQASPPYNLGDGDVPMFIQLMVDRSTGLVAGHCVAPDPIWANNGPTNCQPEVHNESGVGFVRRKDGVSKELMQRAIRGDDSAMEEIRSKQTILVEVNDELKNADMNVVPHCWVDLDLAKYSVVTVDPVGALGLHAFDLMETDNDAYMEFASLLAPEVFEQYFILDNTPLQRNAPTIAPASAVRWKLT